MIKNKDIGAAVLGLTLMTNSAFADKSTPLNLSSQSIFSHNVDTSSLSENKPDPSLSARSPITQIGGGASADFKECNALQEFWEKNFLWVGTAGILLGAYAADELTQDGSTAEDLAVGLWAITGTTITYKMATTDTAEVKCSLTPDY